MAFAAELSTQSLVHKKSGNHPNTHTLASERYPEFSASAERSATTDCSLATFNNKEPPRVLVLLLVLFRLIWFPPRSECAVLLITGNQIPPCEWPHQHSACPEALARHNRICVLVPEPDTREYRRLEPKRQKSVERVLAWTVVDWRGRHQTSGNRSETPVARVS